jgi:hypothetical protein
MVKFAKTDTRFGLGNQSNGMLQGLDRQSHPDSEDWLGGGEYLLHDFES